ncbi:SLIT3 [Branchiostoma lanceolatum]|uniref:SLIT3 protein n=1 Tax=Branchiostoma lanceolatum TaxID=7740 RepID=A0A8K0EI66_BRALA|nr:SLIT3 [Branchiostoma lanceolatum]
MLSACAYVQFCRTAMAKRSRQCVAILVLLVLKLSSPCPKECFVQHEWTFEKKNVCECPRERDAHYGFQRSCATSGLTVAANSVCSADSHGLTCLNDVPTGFDQSVTGIILNRLFNLTTLTKQHIPPLYNLLTFVITDSTIQAIEPGAFSSVPSITWVTIRCSHLLHIGDETFYNLPSLKTIFLKHNLIESISPRAFLDLGSLHRISLYYNHLKVVPFEALTLIRRSTTAARLQVNLENNQISTVLETGWKKISDTGVTLRLRGNPLVCDGGMRWLICNITALALGVIFQARHLRCTSPSELTGCDFQSLHTNSFCSSKELTTTSPMAKNSSSPMAEPTSLLAEPSGTTSSALTQRARIATLGTTDSSLGLVLETDNLDDGQHAGMDYLYIPVGLTATGIVLIGGTVVAVMICRRCVSRRRQNPVHRLRGVIISSQLVSNRMYQHSGATTGDATDNDETDETEKDSARQNPVHKPHGVTINTSELISNRLYKSSGAPMNNANKGTGTAEETGLTPYLTVPFDAINNTLRIEPYSTVDLDDNEQPNDAGLRASCGQNPTKKRHGVIMDSFQITSNRLYKSSASAINNNNKGTGTTEETEENLEVNNILRIEPYSSVNLKDIRNEQTNVASSSISLSGGQRDVQDEDDMEPYATTPLDQIGER